MPMKEIRSLLAEATLAMCEGDTDQALYLAEKVEILVYQIFEILWIQEVKQFGLFAI